MNIFIVLWILSGFIGAYIIIKALIKEFGANNVSLLQILLVLFASLTTGPLFIFGALVSLFIKKLDEITPFYKRDK